MQVTVENPPRVHDDATGTAENVMFPAALVFEKGVLVAIRFPLNHTVFVTKPESA